MASSKTRIRAAIYARKSTEDPRNPGKSLNDQKRLCREEAVRRGLEIVAEFEDSGKSASRLARGNTVREEYAALIELVQAGGADFVMMAEQSRGTRRLSELGTLLEVSADAGVRWIVGGREIDPTEPSDIVLTSVQGGIDAAESQRISMRAQRGAAGSALAGRPPAKTGYGYARLYDPETRALSSVVIVESEAAVLREIRDRIFSGESLYRIARDLMDRGIPSPSDSIARRTGRDSKGTAWDSSNIRRIALNPLYAGLRVHRGEVLQDVACLWDPIFTLAEHRRLEETLTGPARREQVDNKLKHFLSGFAKCGQCNSPLQVLTNRGRYRSYTCPTRGCYGVTRAATPLENLVRDTVVTLAKARTFEFSGSRVTRPEVPLTTEDVHFLKTQLTEIRDALKDGILSVSFAAPLVAELELNLTLAERRARRAGFPLPAFNFETLENTFDALAPAQKRAICAAFVSVMVLRAPKGNAFNPAYVKVIPLCGPGK